MFAWQLALEVRKRVCERELWRLYEQYGNVVLERKRCPEMGPSWHKRDDTLAAIHREMRREMNEIRFLRSMLLRDGDRLVLHRQQGDFHNVEKGPSLKEIMEQHLANQRAAKPWCESDYGQGYIACIETMLDILENPYNYLSTHQQMLYTNAEAAREDIISNRAGPPPQSHARAPAGKHGMSLAQARAQTTDEDIVVRRGPGQVS